MTNQEKVSDIPLEGKGFVARQNQDYKPGEFRVLSNCEMVDGRIIGRRNIRKHHESVNEGNTRPDAYGSIGFYGPWTIYTGPSSEDLNMAGPFAGTQTAYTGTGQRVEMFDPNTMIDTSTEASGFGKIVGFFTYNHKAYWLVFRYNSNVASVGIEVYTASTDGKNDPGDFTVSDITLDTTAGIKLYYNNPNFKTFDFNNFFIFKERLWICTSNGIYFSKATDPSRFEVDNDGGFIQYPDETINYAVAVRDTIYLFGTNRIYSITYSKSPNDLGDITNRQLSDRIGAINACIYQDTPYFINNEGIFSINNSNIEKVLDSDFDEGLNNFPLQTLTPFQDYLIVNKTYLRNVEGLVHPDNASPTSGVVRNNLIPDPSFRGDPNTYWVPYINVLDLMTSETPAIVLPDTNDTHILKQIVGGGTPHDTGFTSRTGEYVKVEAGKSYVFSGYAYRPASSAYAVGDKITPSAAAYDKDGVVVASGHTVSSVISPLLDVADTWVRFSCIVNISDSKITQLKLNVFTDLSGTTTGKIYYFDALMFEEGTVLDTYFDGYYPDTVSKTYTNLNDLGVVDPKVNVQVDVNPTFRYFLNLFPYRNDINSYGNKLEYNTYFINMTNGAAHVLDYKAKLNSSGEFLDQICEIVFNPNVDPVLNVGSLMIRTTDALESVISDAKAMAGMSEVVYMESERNINVWDEIRYISGAAPYLHREIKPRYDIEVVFSPDSFRYLIKKFRNFEIMGILPSEEFQASFYYDYASLENTIALVDNKSLLEVRRPHFPHRIGLNQRASFITVKLAATDTTRVNGLGVPNPYDFLEISNMRVLWTPTNRDVKYSSFSPVT